MKKIDNAEKAIELAHHIEAKPEAIRFDVLRENVNGAILWDVFDYSTCEHRYIIEGETGELLPAMECGEEEAVEAWDNA